MPARLISSIAVGNDTDVSNDTDVGNYMGGVDYEVLNDSETDGKAATY